MTAATYPNHATFATGASPREHGIGTNYVPHTGGFTPAWELGPAVSTLFDACRESGRSSRAVVGDQCLIGVMGARVADTHWPPDGEIPADARRDAHDYIDDADTIVELLRAVDARPDLVVSQLNAPDTAAHVHGPDSEAALAVYRETDARLAVRARPSRLGRHRLDRRVRSRPGDRRRTRTRRPATGVRAAGCRAVRAPRGQRHRGVRRRRGRGGAVAARGRRRRGNRAVPPGRPRARGVPGVVRTRPHVRLRRARHRTGHPRQSAHLHPGGGGHRRSPGGGTSRATWRRPGR